MFALHDVNVLALENGISAPLSTRLLGDLGADVVKVERPEMGDVNRHWDNVVYGRSSGHVWVDRNKKSIELDLKSEEGVEIFLDLAEDADVVVQNYSPGVVERLGLDYESVREVNDDVIYMNISGYGRDGPYSDRKAYDLVMQGESGLILMNGSPEQPAKIPLSICDISTAMYSTLGILAALFNRSRHGTGEEIDVTMLGSVLSWLGYFPHRYWHDGELPERVGTRHHLITPYGPFETADDQYVNVAILSETHWERFCTEVIGREDLLTDERFETNEKRTANREQFEPIIEEVMRSESRDHWADLLLESGIPWGDVNQLDEVLAHPQVEYIDAVRELEIEEGPLQFVDNPLSFRNLDLNRERMPDLGEHTEELLEELGYSSEALERLRREGVV